MSDDESNQLKSRKVSGDDLIEDMFGLNLRGLKTLWVMFVSPRRGYEAARSPDWMDRSYTPSIRLLFSLLAVMTAVRFLWAGADSSMYELIEVQLASMELFETEEALQDATETIINYYLLLFPFSFMLFQSIAALLLPIWGKGTNAIVRVRLYMLALLPNGLATLFMLPAMKFMTAEEMLKYSFAMMSVTLVLDFITSYRGGLSGKRAVQVMKSGLFAVSSNVTGMIANSLCIMVASMIAGRVMGLGS